MLWSLIKMTLKLKIQNKQRTNSKRIVENSKRIADIADL